MITITGIQIPEKTLEELCAQYNVRELSMFGSRARGDHRPDSDLDILVEFFPEARVGLIEYSKLQNALIELFGLSVDLAPKHRLKPIVRAEVLPDVRLIYEAPGRNKIN